MTPAGRPGPACPAASAATRRRAWAARPRHGDAPMARGPPRPPEVTGTVTRDESRSRTLRPRKISNCQLYTKTVTNKYYLQNRLHYWRGQPFRVCTGSAAPVPPGAGQGPSTDLLTQPPREGRSSYAHTTRALTEGTIIATVSLVTSRSFLATSDVSEL